MTYLLGRHLSIWRKLGVILSSKFRGDTVCDNWSGVALTVNVDTGEWSPTVVAHVVVAFVVINS